MPDALAAPLAAPLTAPLADALASPASPLLAPVVAPLIAPLSEALHLLVSGDVLLWQIVAVSLKTSLTGLLLATPCALLAAWLITRRPFPARRLLLWLIQSALAMPTVLIGLLLYLLLSRSGPLGNWHWLFDQKGMIAGQVLIASPVLLAFAISALQALDPRLAETAQTLGARPWQVMLTVLHEARFALMAAVMSAFARVLSEVGCALMIGGNIAGQTRTITTAIALETSRGDFARGIALGLVLLLLALLLNLGFLLLQGDFRPKAL
jgi:tungstate transport system permease protein